MFNLKNDCIVDVPTTELYGAEVYRAKSIWRWWNQLTKFQRSFLYMLVLIGLITVIYFLPVNSNSPVLVNAKLSIPQHEIKKDLLNHVDAIVAERSNDEVEVVPAIQLKQDVLEEPQLLKDSEQYSSRRSAGAARRFVRFSGPTNDKQKAIVDAFVHAWQGYKQFAWGHDHLKPISGSYQDWFGLGLTIIDSLDTMYIMGLKDEFAEARNWVQDSLDFDVNRDVNLFEVTIRVLGGLLSAYHLSGDALFLDKALDLGERLLPCFHSESGVPFSDVNLANRKAHSPKWSPDSSTSEVTTLQLEFRDLSRTTYKPQFEEAAARVSLHIHNLEKREGLVPIFINANTGLFRIHSTITLGARGDSYYEYLLKQWLQTGKTIDWLREDYERAIEGVTKLLTRRTHSGLLFIGELLVGGKDFKPKMDHLTCYLPGTLVLGVHNGMPQSHMRLAEELLYTCYQTYVRQPTSLAAEITYFHVAGDGDVGAAGEGNGADMYVKSNDAHNLLRPEFIESLYYMHQFTGNETYQQWGWQVFQAFERHTKVAHGYTSIGNVRSPNSTRPKDMMESFFLGETLKYLYLLLSDQQQPELDLDKYIINTEAHPLPIYKR